MRTPESHPSAAELEAFALGSLDALCAAVEAHVSTCPDCQRRAADVPGDAFVELLRSTLSRNPTAGRPRVIPSGGIVPCRVE
jgi:hypothetical protein